RCTPREGQLTAGSLRAHCVTNASTAAPRLCGQIGRHPGVLSLHGSACPGTPLPSHCLLALSPSTRRPPFPPPRRPPTPPTTAAMPKPPSAADRTAAAAAKALSTRLFPDGAMPAVSAAPICAPGV